MIDGSQNANVSWLLNFRIRVFMKSAVTLGLLTVNVSVKKYPKNVWAFKWCLN